MKSCLVVKRMPDISALLAVYRDYTSMAKCFSSVSGFLNLRYGIRLLLRQLPTCDAVLFWFCLKSTESDSLLILSLPNRCYEKLLKVFSGSYSHVWI